MRGGFSASPPIEHSGLAAFAFGIGGAVAIFGGLLHMVLHTLIKSALFQALIRAAAGARLGRPRPLRLRASARPGGGQKYLGWALAAAMFALTGMPPSGLFASEFIIISQTIQRDPLLSLAAGAGDGAVRRADPAPSRPAAVRRSRRKAEPVQARAETGLVALHLLLAFALAFAMPLLLFHLLSSVAAGPQ